MASRIGVQRIRPLQHQTALGRVIRDWQQGREAGYPTCCIAHFCWDSAFGRTVGWARKRQIDPDWRLQNVPCGIFHSGGSPHGLPTRFWRILEFQWLYLQPTWRGQWRRRLLAQANPGQWAAEAKMWREHQAQNHEFWEHEWQ